MAIAAAILVLCFSTRQYGADGCSLQPHRALSPCSHQDSVVNVSCAARSLRNASRSMRIFRGMRQDADRFDDLFRNTLRNAPIHPIAMLEALQSSAAGS